MGALPQVLSPTGAVLDPTGGVLEPTGGALEPKTEGRRPQDECRRPKAEGRRPKAEGRRLKPLIITSEQIDEMFKILEKGILKATDDLRHEGLWKDTNERT